MVQRASQQKIAARVVVVVEASPRGVASLDRTGWVSEYVTVNLDTQFQKLLGAAVDVRHDPDTLCVPPAVE
jgi:hypothetical protein